MVCWLVKHLSHEYKILYGPTNHNYEDLTQQNTNVLGQNQDIKIWGIKTKKFCLNTPNKKLYGSFNQKLTTPEVIKSLNVDA